MIKRRLILHGKLRELFDGEIVIYAESVAEAIKGATQQIKAFRPKLGENRMELRVLGCDSIESLLAPSNTEEIHLVPSMHGGKSGGFFKIVLGTVLIATALILSGGTLGAPLAATGLLSGITYANVFFFGAALVLGGILELISPAPTLETNNSESEASNYFGAPGNTVKIGTRIPYLFGLHKAYGHYISFNIDAKTIYKRPYSPPPK